LPNLIVPYIGEAVLKASAKKVYICNLMTQKGETYGFTASDHVRAIYDHIAPGSIQKVIVNNGEIPEQVKLRYKGELATPVKVDQAELMELGVEIITDSIVTFEDGVLRHDTNKLSELIYKLILSETKKVI
jgi:uncharacterized cofD-like protein